MSDLSWRAPVGRVCAGSRALWWIAGALAMAVGSSSSARALVITEIMYHSEELDDRPLEYIEIYNERADPLDLSGYSICNGVSLEIPDGTWLAGRTFLVLCADAEAVRSKHGITNTLGDWFTDPDTSLSLSNSGERIAICNPGGKTVVEVRYNDRGKWPGGADGTGHSLEIISPYAEVDDPDSWMLSNDLGGSPGVANPCWSGVSPSPPGECVPRDAVRLSEAFLLTGGEEAFIELINESGSAISLAGCYLTNEPADLTLYRIPDGTSIAAGGHLVFTQSQLPFDLAVAAAGDRRFIALVEPDPLRVLRGHVFRPELEGFSEARIPGDDRKFADGADPTPGADNTIQVTSDIVINEIMYHPIDNDSRKEYVELYNRGTAAVDVGGYSFSDGIDFTLPEGTTIAAGDFLVIAREPDLLRSIYGLDASRVIGPETPEAQADFGVLRDRGERLTLSDPWGRTVDTVRFHDGGEWPEWPDGGGSSLELIDPAQPNNMAQAWDASDDSAKAPVQTFSYVARHLNATWESELALLLTGRGIALVDDISIIGGGVTTTDTPIIDAGETWRYFKGTQNPPSLWKEIGFDDSGWLSGPTGIGYGDNDDATVLSDMQNSYMTVFCRKTFTFSSQAEIDAIDELWLSVVIDDGFYAYLNGVQVSTYNVSGTDFDDAAPSAAEPVLREADLTDRKSLLVVGQNVLAASVHNAGLSSSDLSFIPRLVDRTRSIEEGTEQIVNGTFDANTSGWMIEGTHIRSGRTTQNPIRGAGSLKVIASGKGDNKVNRIETPQASGFGLSNLVVGEDLIISLKARWIVGAPTIVTHGYWHEMARSHRLDVPVDLGTPGAVNSAAARQIARTGGNLGPVIEDVKNDPAVPDGEQVTVTAKIVDSDGVGGATLHYSLNDASSSPTAVAMTPVGNDRYAATLPSRTRGTRVVFYITAADAAGQTGRYPVDIRERTHPMLVNPPAAALNDLRYAIYAHDVKSPATSYASYRFYTTSASETELSTRRLLSNEPIPGSFLFGSSDIYPEASMRFSGSPWARRAWSGSYRVNMPKDEPLHGRYRKFNLEDNQGNPLDARTRITHYLLRQSQGTIGVPYADDFALVRWQVNARSALTREHNWFPEQEFLSIWFPDDDDGDFFEMDDRFLISDSGTRADSRDGRVLYPPPSPAGDGNGANKENYRWFFNLRSDRGNDDYANFIAFARVMDPGATPDALFEEQIWDYSNVEEMLRIFAVEMNIDDWDTWGCSRGKNCYFYRPEIDGRWNLLCWDVELTYGNLDSFNIPSSPTSDFSPGGFSEVNRMLNRPPIRRMYYGILAEMMSGSGRWFHSSRVSAYATRLAALGMANTGIAQPGGWIDQRVARVEPWFRSVIYPQVRLSITTNGGAGFATDLPLVTLEGTAPVDAASIRVDAAGFDDYTVEHDTMTTWRIRDIPLHPGVNDLSVLGFTFRGAFVDSDSIAVTYTGDWAAPAISELIPGEALAGDDIEIRGSEFHNGVRVFFGAAESPLVVYDEDGADPGRIIARVPAGEGSVDVTVRNLDGQTSNGLSFTFVPPPPMFVRGDANGDGFADLSDAIKILLHLFAGSPTDCQDALDADDTETITVTDAIYVLDFLFRAGPAPRPPFPTAGEDPGGDALGCER